MYVPANVDQSLPEQRILEAAATLPSSGGVTGWAGLRWIGGVWFDGCTPSGRLRAVDLATSASRIRSQPGTHVCTEGIVPHELLEVDGVSITCAVRSVCFMMRYADTLANAVIALDMAAYSDLVSIEELAEYALAHPAWTGIPRCRAALKLADENAWSPAEVRLRLVWTLIAGLPAPLCNRPIFDRNGRLIGTPDLLDPAAGLAIEYDGSVHLAGARRANDIEREELFRRSGLEVLTVVAAHMHDKDQVASRMIDARKNAAWVSPRDRAWTIEPPPWWRSTLNVEQRRALTEAQRARFLAHRLRTG